MLSDAASVRRLRGGGEALKAAARSWLSVRCAYSDRRVRGEELVDDCADEAADVEDDILDSLLDGDFQVLGCELTRLLQLKLVRLKAQSSVNGGKRQ